MPAETLLEQALQLPARERALVVDLLLQSLDAADPVVDATWAQEALARLAAVREGRMETMSADHVLRVRN
jgi:putative addiction module component (TIGR02574 family)